MVRMLDQMPLGLGTEAVEGDGMVVVSAGVTGSGGWGYWASTGNGGEASGGMGKNVREGKSDRGRRGRNLDHPLALGDEVHPNNTERHQKQYIIKTLLKML